MVILTYNDTYDGFLSALFEAFLPPRIELCIRAESTLEQSLLFEMRPVEEDRERVRRITAGMERLCADLPNTVYLAWLSHLPGIEDDILESLRIGFRDNRNPIDMRYETCVGHMCAASKKTGFEAHRFKGYIRLQKTGDDLYIADIEPDYEILPLMGHHFATRFGGQRIIIRDLKRRKAIIAQDGRWHIADLRPEECVPIQADRTYEDYWKRYFKALSNPARENRKLQQHFVPKKYRKHIVEFE